MRHDKDAGMISIEQLAVELGVSVRYVRRVVAERRIPYVKVGHLVRFERHEVDHWLIGSRVNAITDGR